ncbi:neutral zinc metallopeptidase [Parafilimonas sp.]|uniref:KPN_02809 family neutral zinc metallopeptidase n=1 Tax=Parafilimonas sp. TaxID=1969739 RepID=UPI0039E48C51
MQWRGRRESGNIEDRRGMSGGTLAFGGIGGLIIAAIVYFLGGDPSQITQQDTAQQTQSGYQDPDDPNDTLKQYMDVVLTSANEVWADQFNKMGRQYTDPTLVLFTGQTQAGCGMASSATGPFYCPADQKVYIDLSFFNELTNRFGAEKGDFAMAYVLAHELGHHVQHLLGITDKVDAMRQRLSETGYNKLSVKLELQADFLAGVWAHYNQSYLERGDIEEALSAASAVGDDRLQKAAQGRVVPDAFTHGTSQQRMYWFKKGYQTGDISQGDTFNDPSLN